MLITGLDKIQEAQTIKSPTGNDVRLRFPQYTKGYVTAIFNYKTNAWEYGYHEDRESAVQHFDLIKMMCNMSQDTTSWLQYSEMYIYSSHQYYKAKWALLGVVVEE